MAAARDLPVGHFQLPLLTNRGPIVEVTAVYKRRVMESYLERKHDRPERHAIRNLLGVLAFARGDENLARQHFQAILSEGEDPDNLNAKANLKFVNHGTAAAQPDEPDLTSEAGKRQQARRYAEQAYAYMFELFDETVTCRRYETGQSLYNTAMGLGRDLVDRREKEDWQFGIGLASFKILRLIDTRQARGRAQSLLDLSSEMFGAIVASPHADLAIRSEAWLQLALTLKDGSGKRLQKHRQFANQTPSSCLERALELAPDDSLKARILARQAQSSFKADPSDEGFARAMDLLKRSIDFDHSSFNAHAYSARAEICIKQYKRSPIIGYIMQAKDDLELILEQHVSPWDFERLAEAYFYLAKSSNGESREEYIRKGLETCTKSEGCQDGQNRPELHLIRGNILCLNGQHQEAMASYQRGVACETTGPSVNRPALDREMQHV